MPRDGVVTLRDAAAIRRVWSTLEIKAFDDTTRTFEGIASTPSTDRMGDIVEPKGAVFSLPIPLLDSHDPDCPIGHITEASVRGDGIFVKGYVEQVDGPPTLKERLDVAYVEMKSGLKRGLSIGFNPLEYEQIKGSFGYRFTSWEWLELSSVTIPANADASLMSIKSLHEGSRAASGKSASRVVSLLPTPPGDTGIDPTKGTEKMKTFAEQITAFEAKRAATVASMSEIMQKAAEEGRTLQADESEKYDGAAIEVKQIDAHLDRLKSSEQMMVKSAVAVPPTPTQPSEVRMKAGDGVLRNNANVPKGLAFARYVKALAFARAVGGNMQEAKEYAKQWETSTPEVLAALNQKTAVAGGTTADTNFASSLVYNQNLVDEFVEFLRPQTILGKINGFHRVPFNVRFPTQIGGSTMAWVGEGKGRPVSGLTFSSGSLGFATASGIVVITQELARFSSPAADMLVRDDMAAQMIQFLDQQFIDPGVAAVANVSPASVTNGAGNVLQATNNWDTQAHVIADIKTFLSTFATQNIALDNSVYWVMIPAAAIALSMITTANGVYAFPDINVNGGSLYGIPVITSNSVPNSVSAGSIVALVKASEIFLADDNQVAIDTSMEASLQMDGAPTQDEHGPTASTVVSMFQTNSVAIRAARVINWSRRRSYGVGYVDNVHT